MRAVDTTFSLRQLATCHPASLLHGPISALRSPTLTPSALAQHDSAERDLPCLLFPYLIAQSLLAIPFCFQASLVREVY